MFVKVDAYLEMFVQEEEQQAGEVPWRSCAHSCCCDRCSELLGRARGYLGDLLRLCSGRRISGGKGAIALTIRAIRAIEIKIRAVNPSPQEIRKLSYLSDSEGYERFP